MLPDQACGALEDETEDNYEGSYPWVVPPKSLHVLGKGDSSGDREAGMERHHGWLQAKVER